MVKITLKKGKIIEFESDTINIGDYFLYCNKVLTSISLLNVTCIGYGFLSYNEVLEKLYAPKLEYIDVHWLLWHKKRDELIDRRSYV